MARHWVSLHGHRFGEPGIVYRPNEAKPWRVKFIRERKYVNVGHFVNLRQAQAASRKFVENEKVLDKV